jgi:hypothetical protein
MNLDDNIFWKITPQPPPKQRKQYSHIVSYKKPQFNTALIAVSLHKRLSKDRRFKVDDVNSYNSNVYTGFREPLRFYNYEREMAWRRFIKAKHAVGRPHKELTIESKKLKSYSFLFEERLVRFAFENNWENEDDEFFIFHEGWQQWSRMTFRYWFHGYVQLVSNSILYQYVHDKHVTICTNRLMKAFDKIAEQNEMEIGRTSFLTFFEKWRHSLWKPGGALFLKGWEEVRDGGKGLRELAKPASSRKPKACYPRPPGL